MNEGKKAILVLSRENTSMMFRCYSDFFKEIVTDKGIAIALKNGKTVNDLVVKFRTYLAFDVMMAFIATEVAQALRINNE